MNKYIAFYNEKRIEVEAPTSFAAQRKAATEFKLKEKQAYKVTVMLAEIDGKPYVHSTSSL